MQLIIRSSFLRLALVFIVAFVLTGCKSLRVDPPSSLPKIRTLDKLNPIWWFGNIDEPTPPEWYRPDDPDRVSRYHQRNTGHNLTFYVIGVADKSFVRSGLHPEAVFAPDGGWNVTVSRRRICLLPFISYQGRSYKGYFGWRERGNFGIKINRVSKQQKPP